MIVRALTVPLTLHIEVTADDIEEGVDMCDACPIALALTRTIHERDPADEDLRGWTDGERIAVRGDGELLVGLLPGAAREFVERHDDAEMGPRGHAGAAGVMSEQPNAYVRRIALLQLISREDGAGWVCTATCLGQPVGQGRASTRDAAEEAAGDSARALWRALGHAIDTLDAEGRS